MPSRLVPLFRGGNVSYDIRELAAQCGSTGDIGKQLDLSLPLSGDPELAVATLAGVLVETLRAFLARSDVSKDVRDVFAARRVTPGSVPARDDALTADCGYTGCHDPAAQRVTATSSGWSTGHRLDQVGLEGLACAACGARLFSRQGSCGRRVGKPQIERE